MLASIANPSSSSSVMAASTKNALRFEICQPLKTFRPGMLPRVTTNCGRLRKRRRIDSEDTGPVVWPTRPLLAHAEPQRRAPQN